MSRRRKKRKTPTWNTRRSWTQRNRIQKRMKESLVEQSEQRGKDENSWCKYKREPKRNAKFSGKIWRRWGLWTVEGAAGLLVSEAEIEVEMDRIQCVNCTTFRQRQIRFSDCSLLLLPSSSSSPLPLLFFQVAQTETTSKQNAAMLRRWDGGNNFPAKCKWLKQWIAERKENKYIRNSYNNNNNKRCDDNDDNGCSRMR